MDNNKPQPSFYANIPATVRYDKNLCANAKLMYGEITALTNKNGYAWAGNEYFAELYGVSLKTVSRWITQLESEGYIKRVMQYKNNSNEIQQRRIYLNQPNVKMDELGGDKNVRTWGQKCHPGGDKNEEDNNTLINNTLINKNTSSSKDDGEFENNFTDFWSVYPKKVDKGAAKRSYKKALKSFGVDVILAGTIAYADHCKANNVSKQYIKNPGTFLNQESFNNDFSGLVNNNSYKPKTTSVSLTDDSALSWMNE